MFNELSHSLIMQVGSTLGRDRVYFLGPQTLENRIQNLLASCTEMLNFLFFTLLGSQTGQIRKNLEDYPCRKYGLNRILKYN